MMKLIEKRGDMFEEYLSPEICYVIPTALATRNDGGAVMGRGTARRALQLQPSIQKILGDLLLGFGRMPFLLPGNFAAVPIRFEWDRAVDVLLAEEMFNDLYKLMSRHRHLYVTIGEYDFPDIFDWYTNDGNLTVWK